MDQKRAQTLEALEEFIQTQKTLLAANRRDVDRLREVRAAALADPLAFCDDIHTNLDGSSLRLDALPDWQLVIPKGIDWSVFEGLDPAPLQKFTLDTQQAHIARNEPHTTQTSPLSDLQKLVKNARETVLDPALAAFAAANASEQFGGDSASEIDEEEVRREREREKIRQLKKRQIRTCGLKLPGLRMEGEGSSGVYIRHDVDDESVDVDISADDNNDDVDEGDRSPPPPLPLPPPPPRSKSSRIRRATHKAAEEPLTPIAAAVAATTPSSSSATPAPPQPNSRVRKKARQAEPEDAVIDGEQLPKKPKSETYKQAWSLSEQHLLEQLLEQIPEGEKHRWLKISRAMNGRRTPRQVASRVQKYFEKLRKYGLDGRSGLGAEGGAGTE